MQRILSREHDELLRRERALLEELRLHLARVGAPDDDLDLLKRSLQQLDELFLLVVVGEFNAGKTAFLNALLGERLLAEGVTPTTSLIQVLRFGDQFMQEPFGEEYQVVHAPVEWLREINLVDTPGTNAVIQRHQQITEHFVPRSDLVLFVTSVDRPFSESERAFLERIRQWGKKIVIVVNKIDLLEGEGELQEILAFVNENSQHLLGFRPVVFPVSARLALRAKQTAGAAGQSAATGDLWQTSRFQALETYVLNSLDAGERLRLKLENPLGVAENLIQQYSAVIATRQELLKGDFQTLDVIDEQIGAYEEDMRRDFRYQSSRVDNVLYEMAERGDRFFDETMRLGRIFDLVNAEKLRGEFERQVVGDTSRAIERHVNELIDWLVDKDYRQWQAVMEYLNRRSTQHADRIVGQVRSDFEFNRQNLLASVGRDAQRVIDGYDREAESLKLAQDVQRSILQTVAVEVSALGIGALMVALLQTTLLDVTGLLGAGAIAALGFYVLPYRRSKVKIELRNRINELRGQLHAALARQFEVELAGSVQRIREAMAPYTRFIRVEREKLDRLTADIQAAHAEVRALRHDVTALAAPPEVHSAPEIGSEPQISGA